MKTPSLSADQRRQAVALVVELTANTHLTPLRYERRLLNRFELGELSLNEVELLMDAAVYQLFYHSQAVLPMEEKDLQFLLDWSRAYNAKHGITGLLLYSNGRFVQLLEGEKEEVQRLFAQIRLDSRHFQVTTIIEGPGPQLYPDWSMAFGHVTVAELEQALTTIQTQSPPDITSISNAHLQKILHLFT